MMKNVQISQELFVALLHYHLSGENEDEEVIEQGLEQKLDAMLRHELYREKKAMPLIQKLVKVLFALHRKYWEVKNERDKYQYFYQDEKKATRHLSQQLEQVKAENSQLYAMKRDFRRVWNYFGAEKMQQVIGFMREQEQTTDRSQKKNRQNSVEL